MTTQPLTLVDIQGALPTVQAIKEIARGGFKIVFQVTIAGKQEALKLVKIPPSDPAAGGEDFVAENIGRVKREIALISRCQSQEVVKLGSITATDALLAGERYVMYSEEFLPGNNLQELTSERRRTGSPAPDFAELKILTLCLLRAVKEAWGMKVVHRDIKPLNVMKTGLPARPFVLLDFGIAFAINETNLTASPTQRAPMGTWRYMAPEMLRPGFRDNISFRSDLYTTAQTVFEYAVGQHPLARTADDLVQTISRIIGQDAALVEDKRIDLPRPFCDLINQMMKKSPALRPGNLDLLIRQMEAIQ